MNHFNIVLILLRPRIDFFWNLCYADVPSYSTDERQMYLMRITTGNFLAIMIALYCVACGSSTKQTVDIGNSNETTTNSGSTNNTPTLDPNSPSIAEDTPPFRLVGRFEISQDPNHPGYVFGWSASTMIASISGTGVKVNLTDINNIFTVTDPNTQILETINNVFDVYVDGTFNNTFTITSDQNSYTAVENLSDGNHTIAVVKRTSGDVGETIFGGFESLNGSTFSIPSIDTNRRIEFIGDQILVGYQENPNGSTPTCSPDLENIDVTFASLTAKSLDAEFTAIAYPGKGLYQNADCPSDSKTMPDIYPRILPNQDANTWDFSSWIPQVVVVNLGTNDYATNEDPNCLTPSNANMTTTWVTFLNTIRTDYPSALIFAMIGPSVHDYTSTSTTNNRINAQQALQDAITQLGDVHLFYFDCPEDDGSNGYACDIEPSAETHQTIATQLVDAIKTEMGWD